MEEYPAARRLREPPPGILRLPGVDESPLARTIDIRLMRILGNDPAKGPAQIHEPLKSKHFKDAWADPSLRGLYVISLIAYIPQAPVPGYLNHSLKNSGILTVGRDLLGIPAAELQIVTAMEMLALFGSFDYFEGWAFYVLFSETWSLGPLLERWFQTPERLLKSVPGSLLAYLPQNVSHWAPNVASQASENIFDVKKRAVAAAAYNVIVRAGSV
ncbi:hypothetical protein FRC06_009990 [Ceratobasidium sp. 370]|nr:hypothetical protein FRC06_009990 [Ceratobasidium sp. 370]